MTFRRHDRDPSVFAADRNVVLLHEAEHLRIEPQGLFLILDHDARQLDSHSITLTDPDACCFSKIAKAGPIRLKHPGNSWDATVPGTATIERARRLYSEGGTPIRRANNVVKLPWLENPTSMQISVTDRSPPASRSLARSSRNRIRAW